MKLMRLAPNTAAKKTMMPFERDKIYAQR